MKVIPKPSAPIRAPDDAKMIAFVKQYLAPRLAQHPEGLLVIIAGMGQSGSTLLYNMVKALIAVSPRKYDYVSHGPLSEIAYINSGDSSLGIKSSDDVATFTIHEGGFFDLGPSDNTAEKCALVVKTHGYYPIIHHLAATLPNCKVLTPRRDLRDSVVSLCRRKAQQSPEEMIDPCAIAVEQLTCHSTWKNRSDYEFVYEDYILGDNDQKHQIARSIYNSLFGNPDELPSHFIDEILALVDGLPEFVLKEGIEKDKDTPSLLTKYHITNQGKVGGHKEEQYKEVVGFLESDTLFSHWLREHGYIK
jgi:hypothetical protein